MAATYSKPTDTTEWATTSSNVTEPSTPEKEAGHVYQAEAPSAWMNWWQKTEGEWNLWLNERLADGADENEFRIYNPGTAAIGIELNSTGVSINGDLLPETTATYDLGLTGSRWVDLWLSGNATVGGTLAVTGATTLSSTLDVAGNITPNADNTYDLGAVGAEWKDIYIDGVAHIDEVNTNFIDTASATIEFGNDITPDVDDTMNIGTPSKRWQKIYISEDLEIDGYITNSGYSVGILGTLVPHTNKIYNIGSGSHNWKDVHIGGLLHGGKGSDIASINNMGAPGANYCDVTGTTQINTMSATNIQAGTFVTLQFDSNPVVKHATAGTGAQFLLSGSGDFNSSANDTLTVVYDGTYWREVSRTVI